MNSAQDPLEVCFNTEMQLKKKKKTKQNKNEKPSPMRSHFIYFT